MNLIKELLNTPQAEILLADKLNREIESLTVLATEEFKRDNPEQPEELEQIIVNLLMANTTESMIIGFKQGFNTARELDGKPKIYD